MRHATTLFLLLCLTAFAALDASAQRQAYRSVLLGANEVPPVTTPAQGGVSMTIITSGPGVGNFALTGQYQDLTSNATMAHIHVGAAGQNGTIIQNLTVTGGTAGTISGMGVLTAAQITSLQANGLYVNLHTDNFGGGEIRGQLVQTVLIDGDLSDGFYAAGPNSGTIATKQNANAGFGSANNVSEIKYYADVAARTLYIAVTGFLDVESNNGLGLWLGTSEGGAPTGRAAGAALGFAGAGHYMDGQGGGANDDFKADFEVDYMFALNPGGSGGNPSSNAFLDAASFIGGEASTPVGQTNLTGDASQGTGTEGGPIEFAFLNNGGANQGFEMAILFSELGATENSKLAAFAFIVSESGYFSNVTVPGNVTTGMADASGNLGFNAEFSSITGTPFSTGLQTLPVELTAFTGTLSGNSARLAWTTASETNNSGFFVEHSPNGSSFRDVHFAPGAGTTLEARSYDFAVASLAPGVHTFRLRQTDLDGATELSSTVELTVSSDVALLSVAPNPSRGLTNVSLALPSAQQVTVSAYDVTGRLVTTLFSGAADATVSATLSGVAPGVYVIVAQGETFRLTTSATVLR